MSDIHITRWLLRSARDGFVPLPLLVEIVAEHFQNLCPVCRQEMEAFLAGDAEQELDESELEAAEKKPVAQVEAQLRAAREALPGDPKAAEEAACAALDLLKTVPGTHHTRSLEALARAHFGNGRRAQGHLRDADETFHRARTLMRATNITDVLVYAEVDHLEGSLRKDQRRFEEAEALLSRAALFYRLAGRKVDAAKALLNCGASHYNEGMPAEALACIDGAMEDLDPEETKSLYLCALHNRCLCLVELERWDEAADTLAMENALVRELDEPWYDARLAWLVGKIAQGRREPEMAEEWYGKARELFLEQSDGYHAALVNLDLALLFIESGERSRVQELAREIAPIFEAEGVHEEALAALVLFREAALDDSASQDFIRRVIVYLRQGRNDPERPFLEADA